MPRIRKTISIDEKIAQAELTVQKYKEKYESAAAELVELKEKRESLKKKELIDAIEMSTKSYEEILAFLSQE